MASRKEQKERLRAERVAAEQQSHSEQRRKRVVGLAVAAVLGLAMVAVVVLVVASGGGGGGGGSNCADAHIINEPGVTTTARTKPDCRSGTKSTPGALVTNVQEAAKAAGCKLESPKDEGNQHLGAKDKPPVYKSKPPTSGNHDPVPLADGAYAASPPPRNFIHTLEHGRVEILYSPQLGEAGQLALKGVFDESWQYMAIFPYSDMPYQVAATGWAKLLGCPEFDDKTLDAVRAFRDVNRGAGPESAGSQPG
jgi:hypothetical protein